MELQINFPQLSQCFITWNQSKPLSLCLLSVSRLHLSTLGYYGSFGQQKIYLFENRAILARETITNAIKEAREWLEANTQPSQQNKRSQAITIVQNKDRFSCYIDGAWKSETRQGGMGWLIQDTRGNMILQGSGALSFILIALMAGTLALRLALTKVTSDAITDLQIFSDCEVLINTLNLGTEQNEIAGILFDIRSLAPLFSSLYFFHISRTVNIAVDTLAKTALCNLSPGLEMND